MSTDRKIVQLNCPGKKVPIRTAPNIQAELVRYAINNESIEVYNKTTGGFFKLADGTVSLIYLYHNVFSSLK